MKKKYRDEGDHQTWLKKMFESLFALVAFGLVIAVFLLLLQTVGDMAKSRGHSPWPWWILFFVWSPFGSIIILWLFFDVLEEDE